LKEKEKERSGQIALTKNSSSVVKEGERGDPFPKKTPARLRMWKNVGNDEKEGEQ